MRSLLHKMKIDRTLSAIAGSYFSAESFSQVILTEILDA